MIDLARIGGPVACLGLALLLVATTRRDRIAGLGFAAFGSCLLGAAIWATQLRVKAIAAGP